MATAETPFASAEMMLKGLPMFFTAIAPYYGHLTGNATQSLFAAFLDDEADNIVLTSSSRIHDNAAGPGTATDVIFKWLQANGSEVMPSVDASDSVPAMIDALKAVISLRGDEWSKVSANVVDAHILPYSSGAFTHSICNFSIFTFAEPIKALQEVYRTLEPGGLAIFSTWKRFAPAKIMRAAQIAIMGEAVEAMPVLGDPLIPEGVLASLFAKSGWEQSNIRTTQKSVLIKEGSDYDGLVQFMTGPMTAITRAKFSDDAKSQWPAAVQAALKTEIATYGGVLMEGWFVVAMK